MYQALYRKWRPKTFDEVVGQKHITETLKNQISTGRCSHAYLFIGTRGTGINGELAAPYELLENLRKTKR